MNKKKRMLGGSNSGLFDSDADSAQKNARYEDRTHDLRITRWHHLSYCYETGALTS